MVKAVFAPTANYRVVGWFKVSPKPRSSDLETKSKRLGRRLSNVANLQRDGIGTGVESLTCHGELELFHAEIQTLGREINGFGNYK
jgi:hypothetical protein